jgi:hypothetical protein
VQVVQRQAQRLLAGERAKEPVEPVEGLALDGIGREVAHPAILLGIE